GSHQPCTFNNVFFNVDPALSNLRNSPDGTANIAKFYNAQVWPFIQIERSGSDVLVEDSMLGLVSTTDGAEAVLQLEASEKRLIMRNNTGSGPYNVRMPIDISGFTVQNSYPVNTPYLGFGEFDVTPFLSVDNKQKSGRGLGGDRWRSAAYSGQSPTWGFR